MMEHGNLRDPVLINTIGHTAGLLLFGLIIFLFIQDWRARGIRQIRLSLVAALLALAWNAGSLVVLASSDTLSLLIRIVIAGSFSVLSMLPAVLLQVALPRESRLTVAAGYVVSGCAVALHCSELFSPGIGLHQAALFLVVIGFGVLTVARFFSKRRHTSDKLAQKSEWISLGCLVLFTSSFLHFGYQHVSSPWAAEIAWHHIGIPVALIVLLQDYRFLLLDTFIRFLVNFGLAAVYLTAVLVLNQRLQLWNSIRPNMYWTGMALVTLGLSLILFAYLRNAAQAWVGRVIFRRQSVDDCLKTIVKLAWSARSEEELLAGAAQQVARHLRTDRFAVWKELRNRPALQQPSVLFHKRDIEGVPPEDFHAEAQIPLRFSSGDARFLVVGARRAAEGTLVKTSKTCAGWDRQLLSRWSASGLRN